MKKPKITFVAYGHEHLSIGLLSSIAKKNGYEVGLAYSAALFQEKLMPQIKWLSKIFDDTDSIIKAVKEQKPDVIAFSVVTATYNLLLDFANDIKKILPQSKIIFGGVHPSAVPDRIIKQKAVDFVVIGEGEQAFLEILKAIEDNDFTNPITNTWYKDSDGKIIKGNQKGFLQDLDSLPVFDKKIWEDYIRMGDLYSTMTSRGCIFNCTFCFNHFYKNIPSEKNTKYVRYRSVDSVIDELKEAKQRYHVKYIDFVDDMFTTDKVWLSDFLIKYKKEIDLPFHCLTHHVYLDKEIVKWLSEAGCRITDIGIQTFDKEYKKEYLKRFDDENEIANAIQWFKEYKIKVIINIIFGLPNEKISAQEKALNFFAEHTPDRIETFWYCYFPGTELLNYAVRDGLLSENEIENILDGKNEYLFQKKSNIIDIQKRKQYMIYEAIFKLLPLLSAQNKKRITYSKFSKLPFFILKIIIAVSNRIIQEKLSEPRVNQLKKHILYHAYRITLNKLHLKSSKASKIYS